MGNGSAQAVRVDLGERSYTVSIGPGLLTGLGAQVRRTLGENPTRAFVVCDTGVPGAWRETALRSLRDAGLGVTRFEVTPTEAGKSVATLQGVLARMGASGHSRADPVVALGGGIVGDLAGFAAACYQRGVPVVQCPSTLLSMADASVGGKTGVNLLVPAPGGGGAGRADGRLLKNMVGAFHQPVGVIADTGLLASLPIRHRRAGLAECVKHAMIAGGITGDDLMTETASRLPGLLEGDEAATIELIARSVAVKAAVVRRDERESIGTEGEDGGGGVRMLLNLGHTFGHAIETLPGLSPDPSRPDLSPLHHGEAVALGMVAACATAAHAGLCPPEIGVELDALLRTAGLPTRVAGLPDCDEVLSRMVADKKAAGGVTRLVLPTARGVCRVVRSPDERAVRAGIDAMRA